jgi:hypothetical protein
MSNEPKGEPVAYGYWNKHLGWYGLSLQPGGSYTEPDRRPLYAHPPPQGVGEQDTPAPALREALLGLLARHGDGSSEGAWAEWDTAREALASAPAPALREAARNLLEACYAADAQGELAGEVDGSLLDAVRIALGGASPASTPAPALTGAQIKKLASCFDIDGTADEILDFARAVLRAAFTSAPAPTLTEEQIDRLWEAACEGPTSAVSAFARSIWELALASPTGDTRPRPDINDRRDIRDTFGGETDCHPTESQSQNPEAADGDRAK